MGGALWEGGMERTRALYPSTPEGTSFPSEAPKATMFYALESTLSCVLRTGNTHMALMFCV